MYRTVLFDLDGTLIDSAPGIMACAQVAVREMGGPERELSFYKCMVGPPVVAGLMTYFGMSREEAERCHHIYRQHYEDIALTNLSLFPGIESMLRQLQAAGVTLAVATSKPEIYARRILEDYGLTDCFAVIAGSTLDGSRSTKTQVLHHALDQLRTLGVETENAVLVGDRRYDVQGAHEVGIKCIGVGYGYAETGELETAGADCIVPDLQGVLQEILR